MIFSLAANMCSVTKYWKGSIIPTYGIKVEIKKLIFFLLVLGLLCLLFLFVDSWSVYALYTINSGNITQ